MNKYIYIYIYIYVYIFVYLYIYIYVCISICIYTHMFFKYAHTSLQMVDGNYSIWASASYAVGRQRSRCSAEAAF